MTRREHGMPRSEGPFTVSQVQRLTGATLAQLRNWDAKGVLVPQRTGEDVANNRKLYSQSDLEKVRDILLLQELGMSLRQIRDVLDAPEQERRAAMAACAASLQERYGRIQQQILLASVAEAHGLDALREAAAALGGCEAMGQSFQQDENLRAMVRWLKSHPERDVQLLQDELMQVAAGFEALGENPDWSLVEQQVGRFCDLWSKRFGWPSVGQMALLFAAFSEPSELQQAVETALGKEATRTMAQAFLLAWTSAALECLDDILAFLYKRLLETSEPDERLDAAEKAGDVLAALACELGCKPHLHGGVDPDAVREVQRLTDAVFGLLVDAALDDELGRFLDLDALPAIDGPGVEAARLLAQAGVVGTVGSWMDDGGDELLQRRAADWRDQLMLRYEAELAQEGAGAEALPGGDEDLEHPGFQEWFDAWFQEAHPDEPEACWATEDESCASEKRTRGILQEAEGAGG